MAAGIGARCALRAFAEALGGRCGGGGVPSAAQTAVALVTAFHEREDATVRDLLDEADLRDVAGLLAAATALYLQAQPDGPEWLRRAGLAAAEGAR
ncbi:hypothetical protein [Streptomyces sp. NBC_00271]|uniref:hypothetical protein n=1 Tax=Streptomyces sp. NBC_00271 TaxID=2975697 RepID=UPI002E2E55FF|nr:hypothetical protein [Streptomyces sp. NBC_00271]